MAKMIQIGNVPDDLRRVLKARAAMAGMSLSDWLAGEIGHLAERPTVADLRARLTGREPVATRETPAEAVRVLQGEI